jgi:hypothetical protein
MKTHSLAIPFMLLANPVLLWADGETRAATAAESQYSLRVLSAVSKAVPNPPTGFALQSATKVEACTLVDMGTEKFPMKLSYSASWIDRVQADLEKAQKSATDTQAAASFKSSGAQAQMKALMAQQTQLVAEYGKAVQQKDAAKSAALKKQIDDLSAQLGQLMTQATAASSAQDAKPRKSHLLIQVTVNLFDENRAIVDVVDLKSPSGDLAYTFHSATGGGEDQRTVFVGPWSKTQANNIAYYRATPNRSFPYTKVQTLKVTATGDPDLTLKLLQGMDWAELHALISK